jgi:hypothetical protein
MVAWQILSWMRLMSPSSSRQGASPATHHLSPDDSAQDAPHHATIGATWFIHTGTSPESMQGWALIIGARCTLAAENAGPPVFEHPAVARLLLLGACRPEVELT